MSLTDQQAKQLAEQWWRQKDKPLEPFWTGPKMVPLSELKPAGAGELVASALASRQAENLGTGPYCFSGDRALWPTCMNCGEKRRGVYENGGWCDGCSRGAR